MDQYFNQKGIAQIKQKQNLNKGEMSGKVNYRCREMVITWYKPMSRGEKTGAIGSVARFLLTSFSRTVHSLVA